VTQDLLYALRYARKHWGLFLASGSLLAAGVGACTIVAGIAHGLLWGDLPYPNGERLVFVYEASPSQAPDQGTLVSIPTLEDWRAANVTLDGVAGASMGHTPSVLRIGDPERVQSYGISSGILGVLGVSPIVGRLFSPEEEVPGAGNRVVLLSHEFWNRRLGADPDILGKSIPLDNGAYNVIGVMPRGFTYPPLLAGRERADFWVPAVPEPDDFTARDRRVLLVIARLKSDVTVEQARTDLEVIAARIGKENPATNEGWGVRVSPIHRRFIERGESRGILLLLGVAVSGVLLLACVNVAGLLLARAVRRRTEMAIMMALGAARTVLLRRLLAEGVLLGVTSAAGALLLAWAGLHYVDLLIPANVPRVNEISVQATVGGLGAGLGVLTATLCSAVPLLTFTNNRASEALREASQFPSRDENRLGTLVIAVQVAVATLLLTLSVAAIMRFDRMLADAGGSIAVNSIVTAQLSESTALASNKALRLFHREALAQVRTVPGVVSASLVSELPLSARQFSGRVGVRGRESTESVLDQEALAEARRLIVSPEYFRTIGVPLLQGRDFNALDTAESKRVVIVSRSLASKLQSPEIIGEQIRIWGPDLFEVVGVAADAPLEFGRHDLILYCPATQVGSDDLGEFPEYVIFAEDAAVVVRTSLPAEAIAPALRTAVWSANDTQPVTIQSMVAVLEESSAPERLTALVFVCFALLAAVLAATGIYGVLTFYASRRTREIGLRKSFGAESNLVTWFMIARVMRVSLAGVLLGGLLTVLVQRLLSSAAVIAEFVSAIEWAASGALILVVAILAGAIPAFRAARLDPAGALRHE